MGIRHQKKRAEDQQPKNKPARKKGRLIAAFKKACRKGLLAAFMGASIFMPMRTGNSSAPARQFKAPDTAAAVVKTPQPTASAAAPAEKPARKAYHAPANKNTAQSKIAAEHGKLSPYDALTNEQKEEINQALLQQARADYPKIVEKLNIQYSRNLDSLQNALTQEIQRITQDSTKTVAVIDAYDLDVGIALGMTEMDTLIRIFEQKNIPINERQIWTLYWSAMIDYMTSAGDKTYSQGPFCLPPQAGDTGTPTILLPASDNTRMITIDSLAFDKVVELVNRHESWHVLDNRFDLSTIDFTKLEGLDIRDTEGVLNNPEALKYMALMYKVETSADVAAVCEMIRNGSATLNVIDLLAASRAEAPHDMFHMSPPVLKGLKAEIEAIGIERLQSMTVDEARDFYYRVTHTYGMSETSIEYCLKMKIGDDQQKDIYRSMGARDAEIQKGIDLYDLVSAPEHSSPVINFDIMRQLAGYDGLQELKDRAYQLDQVVTPQSIINAYASLMDELAQARKADPSQDELLTNKMSRLKSALVLNLAKIDYVAVNKDLGVPLEKIVPEKQGTTYVMAFKMPAHVKHIGPRYG